MLFELVNECLQRIQDLDPDRDAPAFARGLLELDPGLGRRLGAPGLVEAVAGVQIGLIRELPAVVQAMQEAVAAPATFPAVRTAQVGALAYLVKPRDLMPDFLPGGLGFLDDALILRTTATGFFGELHAAYTTPGAERRKLRFHALCIPEGRKPDFQRVLDEAWALFHRLLTTPAAQAEATTRAIVQDPYGPLLPEGLSVPPPPPAGPAAWLELPPPELRLEGGRLLARFPGEPRKESHERALTPDGKGF